MNRFFTDTETYEARLSTCKGCEHYFKLTGNCTKCGCFMRIKAGISIMSCPVGKWEATNELGEPELPAELLQEVLELYPQIEHGQLKDHEQKQRFIELYNTIYDTKYKVTTNCPSCMKTMFNGIQAIYKKYGIQDN